MTAAEIDMLEEIFGQGLAPQDVNDYFDVIREAYTVHLDRERIRNGLWKDYPAVDQFNQVRIKDDRILRSLERLAITPPTTAFAEQEQELRRNIADEGFDIINYTVFGVRILRGQV